MRMRMPWDMVKNCALINSRVEAGEGQFLNGIDYYEEVIKKATQGRTSIPREYYALYVVDSTINRLFPTILPADLLLMAYLYITIQWKKADTLRKAYKTFRVVNRYRLTGSDVLSAMYVFQTRDNELSKEDVNK